MVDYMVIKDFTDYIRDDMLHKNMERASYGIKCLEEICRNVLYSLNTYLTGEKIPQEVTRYVTSPVNIPGSFMIGRAINPVTKEEKIRPLFFTGYGHFDQIIKDIPKMKSYGVDILQTEIGPWHTVTGPDEINISAIEKLENILVEAGKNNVRVDVLLAPHYFPEWALQKYPYLRENTGSFIAYNILEPEAKKIIEIHITEVIKRIKDYPALNSVCLSNEPVFSTAKNFKLSNKEAVVNLLWQQFLTDTHNTIDALNNVYKTGYRSFEAVPMPKDIEATPQFFDWMTFNDKVFGGWHEWLAEIIHNITPDIPVHAKIMDAVLSPTGWKTSLQWGIDPEYFAQFSQLNGNDANNYIFRSDASIVSKIKWYDFLMSIKKMPVYNSEDHIIEDRSQEYIPEQVSHTRTDIWQGAIHGRAATTIWVWERTHIKNSDFAGSILHRPDVVSVVGKTNLDLNRLAYEVTALQNEPAQTAILYSNPSRVYDEDYLPTVDKVYKGLIFNGIKPAFITERQLAAEDFKNYKTIIVPAARHINPDTLYGIKNFIAAGNNVVLTGEGCLSRDFYGRNITNPERDFIMENSTLLKDGKSLTEMETWNSIRDFFYKDNFVRITLKDNSTGEPVHGVEWLSTEYNGNLLINICNYEWGNSKTVCVFLDGNPVENAIELISGSIVNGSNLELAPYTPILLLH
jgi:hypothetical protein